MLLSEEEEEREDEEKIGMPSLRTLRLFSFSKDQYETAPTEEKGSPQGHTANKWVSKG